MPHFKEKDVVEMGDALFQIEEFINSGTQGGVYKAVDLATGEKKALKFVFGDYAPKKDKETFYERTRLLTRTKDLHPAFAIPEKVGEFTKNNCFCYTMPLKEGFTPVSRAIKYPDVLTKEQKALLSVRITEVFSELENAGFIYTDISSDNVMYKILPGGDIEVCVIDCENITVEELTLGLQGTGLFRAPEVILGKSPDRQSMNHSIAVLIYRILIAGTHPLTGSSTKDILVTPEIVEKAYGKEPIFVFDESPEELPYENRENLPYKSAEKAWYKLPRILKMFFLYTFSQKALKRNPSTPRMDADYLLACLKDGYNL